MDSTSPSSSSANSLELTPYKPTLKCQICDKPAHGYHHGALTCRACCIFFRRSFGVHQTWKCKEQNNCKNANEKGYFCKKCRIEKCFKAGMTTRKFQFDRDAIVHTQQVTFQKTLQIPTSVAKFIGRPNIIIRCEPKSTKYRKTFLDLTKLVDKGSDILTKTYDVPTGITENPSCMEKLAIQFKKMRNVDPYGSIVYRKIGQKESMLFWEIDFCRAAEWLARFDEFQKLPISLKMKFLKVSWNIWAILEKVVYTVEKQLKNECPIGSVALADLATIDIENMEIDLSWCTHYELDKLAYFLDVNEECERLSAMAQILIDLKPTDVEINFMMLQICFRYAGRRCRDDLQEISEQLLESVSNQMHDYYSNVLKTPHYSGRIAKLMKCDQYIQGLIVLRKQKIDIAQIFDIFDLQYSHPEMFIDASY